MNIYGKISLTAASISLLASASSAATWYNYYWSRGVSTGAYQAQATNDLLDDTPTYSRNGLSNRFVFLGTGSASNYYMTHPSNVASSTKFDSNGYINPTYTTWQDPAGIPSGGAIAFHVGYLNSSLKGTDTTPSALNINTPYDSFGIHALFLELNPTAKATNSIISSTNKNLAVLGDTTDGGGEIGVEIRRQSGSGSVASDEKTARATFNIDMNMSIKWAYEYSNNYNFFRFANTTNIDFTLGSAANNRILWLEKSSSADSMATYLFNFTYLDKDASKLSGTPIVNVYSTITGATGTGSLILSGRTPSLSGDYADMGALRPIVNFMGSGKNTFNSTVEIHSSVVNLMKSGTANAISWNAGTKPTGDTSNIVMRFNSYLNVFGGNQIASSSSDRIRLAVTGENTVGTVNLNGTNLYVRSLATDTGGGSNYAHFVFDYGMTNSGMSDSELAANVTANTSNVDKTGYGKAQTLALGTMQTNAGNIVTIKNYMYGEDILLVGSNYGINNTDESRNIIIFDTSFYRAILKAHDAGATLVFGENASEYSYWYAVESYNAEDYQYKLELSEAMKALVPEPSTYALIFGVLALSFAAYKRRKN